MKRAASNVLNSVRLGVFAIALVSSSFLTLGSGVLAQEKAISSKQDLKTRMLERRAVEAVIWGMPLVNFDALRQAYLRDGGARYNDILYWSRPSDWRVQLPTPNHTTPYVMSFFDLRKGPVVLDIPATGDAGLLGTLVDAWTRPLQNIISRPGQGQRWVVLPPDYSGTVPAGLTPVRSPTFGVYTALRSLTKTTAEADLARGVAHLKQISIYPLAAADAPPATRFIDMSGKLFDGIARFDASFYQALARMVGEETLQEQDLALMGQLRALNLAKDQKFTLDARLKPTLDAAAKEAQAYLMAGYADWGVPIWGEQRKWRTIIDPQLVQASKLTFFTPAEGVFLDERAYAWFALAGPGYPQGPNVYMKSYETGKGESLDGSHTYRLRLPAQVPAKQFWSVDLYDAHSAAFIRQAQVVGVDSFNQSVQKNADGSIDLYFAPEPPAGRESNWISTRAGQPFFAFFRVFGPEPSIIDRSWVLSDIERIN